LTGKEKSKLMGQEFEDDRETLTVCEMEKKKEKKKKKKKRKKKKKKKKKDQSISPGRNTTVNSGINQKEPKENNGGKIKERETRPMGTNALPPVERSLDYPKVGKNHLDKEKSIDCNSKKLERML